MLYKVLYNIKCWKPMRKKIPSKELLEVFLKLHTFLIKILENTMKFSIYGDTRDWKKYNNLKEKCNLGEH